ncbi:MAG TPA: asparaginase [Geminicoccaceae bacterium]|nr:asparaginase [Geminicoccus sp.]HMU48303.1 asparaginase [Geminicoccaceae bacterium]
MVTVAPVAVEVWRGGLVESRHRAHVCIADAAGRVVEAIGDVDQPVYPRSAVKPFQALPLVESGAADAFGLGDAELALACASHSGEPMHVGLVERWLARLGLDESALACGGHPPIHAPTAAAMAARGERPRRVHDNCSGKHCGMLTASLHLGLPVAHYAHADGTLQRRIAGIIAELADLSEPPPSGTDGCSLPTWALPLRGLAIATARLARPDGLPAPRRAALERVSRAMRRHPELVAGTGRCCTAVMQALPDVTAKTGAEGVYIAALHAPGLGLALKVEDGATRASEAALVACLRALGAVHGPAEAALAAFGRPVLHSRAGEEVGAVAALADWPGRMEVR